MKKYINFVIAMLLIFASAMPAWANEPYETEIVSGLSQSVDSMVGSGGAKGAVLSIVQGDEIMLCTGFGMADESSNIEADGTKTAFRIGSVSKTFVAVAAMILHMEGRLDMNQDISAYLEADFPKLRYPVTMHQLLTHTAGFEDIITGMAVYNVNDTEPLSESMRKYMPAQVFRPGDTISYSNYGTALAAYVVECISGQDFSEFCMERIFIPLDMTSTTYEYVHDNVSKAYKPDGSEALEPFINIYPEGSAVSTAEDMAKYMIWLLDEKDERVLTAESKKELFNRQFAMSDELGGIGYIWNRKSRNGAIYYDKKGETVNFYTRIALYPEKKTGIFLSFNTYLPEHEINKAMKKATDILYGEQSTEEYISEDDNIDISGYYVNNWSSFTTPEKILRYIVPGKMIYIRKKSVNTFYINGEKLIRTGTDTYSSPMGILKFIERDGKTIIAAEGAITYSKASFLNNQVVLAFIPLLFAISALIILARAITQLFRQNSKNSSRHLQNSKSANVIWLFCSLFQFLSFIAMCLFVYNGIASFSLLGNIVPIKLTARIIAVSGLIAYAYTIYCLIKRIKISKPIVFKWNMINLMFILWMYYMNFL